MQAKLWQLQEAKNRFSELVETALVDGVQTVTRHGKPTVVVMSIDSYNELCPERERSWVDWLTDCPDGEELSEILSERDQREVRDIEL